MIPAEISSIRPELLAGYNLRPGVADELFDRQGKIRPVWSDFITQLATLDPSDIAARFARGDQYLRDAGVNFRLYSGGPAQERDWPLSHIPVLIPESEWAVICDGLAQRADLLERVVADLYGAADLVNDGHLPAGLVAGNPQWLRPLVGITPPSGHWLHHLVFEIGRSPDGSFFVLGDRAQAPSGSGFALENRMATTRIFSEPFSRTHIQRFAGFFRRFSEAMDELAGPGRSMAILTPGPNNDTYYEQAYIARYLGLTLLEGEDLIVRDGNVMVRTVRGLEPLGLLWRRIDSEFADPLALNDSSRIGTPGLVEAIRQGNISLINALGSGVIEARAFMAFLPRLCQIMLGEPLKLANIATWWCGQDWEREQVLRNADNMVIGGSMDAALPFTLATEGAAVSGPEQRENLRDLITKHGAQLVGQEAVTLSTTPVWSAGSLVPRPMTIRVIAARTAGGWTFMPGGYARIGGAGDNSAMAMQAGGSVADVWVMAQEPVQPDTLVAGAFQIAPPGILPSRAAENLYWLGRYVERTEGAIRLLRAWHMRFAETSDISDSRLKEIAEYMKPLGTKVSEPIPDGLIKLLASAISAAGKVRDRFSPDGWAALNDLSKSAQRLVKKVQAGGDAAHAMSILLRKISGFSGLVHENMYHFLGWRFLAIGRAHERAEGTLLLLTSFAAPDAAPGMLEVTIEVCDSVMTHQRRYRFAPSRESVLDLLMLDSRNPRSVQHQIAQMRHHVSRLPQTGTDGRLSELERALLTLDTDLRVSDPVQLDSQDLAELRQRLGQVYALISSTLLL